MDISIERGFIYTRINCAYLGCKLGKTIDLYEEEQGYAASEVEAGHFDQVFAVPRGQMALIMRWLELELREIQINHGEDLFLRTNVIESLLQNYGVKYLKLSRLAIDKLAHINKEKYDQMFLNPDTA